MLIQDAFWQRITYWWTKNIDKKQCKIFHFGGLCVVNLNLDMIQW